MIVFFQLSPIVVLVNYQPFCFSLTPSTPYARWRSSSDSVLSCFIKHYGLVYQSADKYLAGLVVHLSNYPCPRIGTKYIITKCYQVDWLGLLYDASIHYRRDLGSAQFCQRQTDKTRRFRFRSSNKHAIFRRPAGRYTSLTCLIKCKRTLGYHHCSSRI